MKIKVSPAQRIFDVCNVIFMLFMIVIMLYPMWYVACASFSNSNILLGHQGPLILPIEPNLEAYKAVFTNPMIISGYKNTLIILIFGVTLNLVLTSIAAYCLSRKLYLGKFFMKMITITMYISGGMIPTYLLVTRTLHMNNSLLALIIPTAISTYNLIIMRTSFSQIPESLIESARLDGANNLQILWKIVIPVSKAIVSVMVLYYAVSHWNSWFNASIYLKDRSLFPLQLVLREILIQNNTSSMSDALAADQYAIGESIKYAVIIVATVPILLIYPYLQKYFTKGVMIGAVKG